MATVLALLVLVHAQYLRALQADPWCVLRSACGGPVLAPERGQHPAPASSAVRPGPHEPPLWQLRTHTGVAALLGLAVLAIALVAWRRRQRPGQQLWLPMAALVLAVFQIMVGAWAQASAHPPLATTIELLAGSSLAAVLWWLALRHGGLFTGYARPLLGSGHEGLAPWVLCGVLLLYAQLFLGAWLSGNDAAQACADFPLCQGEWLPTLDLDNALRVWQVPITHDGSTRLGSDARITIHLLHRIGAVVVLGYLGWLSLRLLRGVHDERLNAAGGALGLVLTAQVGAGIAAELLGFPLSVAHGAGAVLLLLTLVSVYHVARPSPSAI